MKHKSNGKSKTGGSTRFVALRRTPKDDELGRSAQRQAVVKALTSLGATSASHVVAIDRVVSKAAPSLKLKKGVKAAACVAFHLRALKNEKLLVEERKTA